MVIFLASILNTEKFQRNFSWNFPIGNITNVQFVNIYICIKKNQRVIRVVGCVNMFRVNKCGFFLKEQV